MPKKILIIGAGSSAQRFAKILLAKKYDVDVYQHRTGVKIEGCGSVKSLDDALGYTAAIISSPTASHLHYAKKILPLNIPIFVEKPFADSKSGVAAFLKQAKKQKTVLKVGFNMRYVPAIQKITEYLHEKKLGKVLYAHIHVGQYLPQWRPKLNYAKTYSANYAMGGGAALDLIHEIDLTYLWFPKAKLQIANTKKLSSLHIDVEDYVKFMNKKDPHIWLTLDYLSHIRTRRYHLVGEKASIICDLYQNSFIFKNMDGHEETITDPAFFDATPTYEKELDDFLKLKYQPPTERELGIDALRTALKARRHVQK